MFKKSISFILILAFLLSLTSLGLADEIKVINTGIDPVLVIEDIQVNDKVPIGKDFYITFIVRNVGSGTAYYPKFIFDEQGENKKLPHFTVGKEGNIFESDIKEIKSQEKQSIVVKMRANEGTLEREEGYKINVTLECTNAILAKKYANKGDGENDGEKSYFDEQNTFTTHTILTLYPKYTLTDPKFVISNIEFEPKEPDLSKPFKAKIFFENISDSDAENVSFSIVNEEEKDKRNFEVVDLSYTHHLFDVKAKQKRMVTYNLEAEQPRDGNDIKVKFDYNYQGEDKTQEEVINLPLPREDIGASGKTPWVIIKKYTLSSAQILAGNTVNLSLFVENTNDKDVYNAKVSIVDVQLKDDEKGDTVFSPVDSSNTFYIDKIPGKTTVQRDIALYVDPNAQAKTYNVPIEIVYEHSNGKDNKVDERINIPVTQDCKFEILSTEIPKTASVGMPVPIAAEFVNVGKVDLTNFMVNLEGEFPKENGTYYIGNLEKGMSDYYQAMAIPEEEGDLKGAIVFSYTDNNNQEVRVEEPFTIKVESAPEPSPDEMGMEGEMMPDGPGGPGGGFMSKLKNNWLATLLGIVILAQIVFIWRMKKKMKANGEFFDA